MTKDEIKSSPNHDTCHLIGKSPLIHTKISRNCEPKTIVNACVSRRYTHTHTPKNKNKNKNPPSNDLLSPQGGQLKNNKC